MPLVLNGATSGSTTIQATDAVTQTLTLPNVTGTVMVNGPAFSAYLGTSQNTTTGVATKIQFNTEEFDTNSNYDNATNYRFTPTVAGYYQVSSAYCVNTAALTRANIGIYKNGSLFKSGSDYSNYTGINVLTVSALVYCNGSTDYIEIYALQTGTTPQVYFAAWNTYFQAAMVRGA